MLPLVTTLLPIVGDILKKIIPDKAGQQKALMELQLQLADQESKLIDALVKSDVAQAEINKIEAESSSMFKSGWRPALSWCCVLGFMWNIFLPVVVWGIRLCGYNSPDVPIIGGEMLTSMTFGILGLGAYRTYEKKVGITK